MFRIPPLKHLVLLAAGFAQLCGCSGAQMLDLIIPDTGYTLHKDVAYGNDPRQKLDVYVPTKPDANGGVILFFYGGSWQKGTKDIYRFVGQTFASRGYVTVVADYRLYPQVYYPDFMHDSASALRWVHSNISTYGGNADNVFVAGHSAGAYNAIMLALNEHFIKEAGGKTSWIRGAIGLAGPYDFRPFTDPDIQSIFSQVDDEATQPITYVRKGAPPLLLLAGEDDEDVLPGNSRHLEKAQREKGGQVNANYYPGIAHIGIILALADGFHSKAPTLEHMLSFIKTHEANNDAR